MGKEDEEGRDLRGAAGVPKAGRLYGVRGHGLRGLWL